MRIVLLRVGRCGWGECAFPTGRGAVGHSDGDVLLHALADAMLGAAALGDLGTYFPSSDPQYRDAPSRLFLGEVRAKIHRAGWQVGQLDATIIAEQPRLAPHLGAIRTQVAALLALPAGEVSVKAKSSDGLGFCGREEGLAAQVVVILIPAT